MPRSTFRPTMSRLKSPRVRPAKSPVKGICGIRAFQGEFQGSRNRDSFEAGKAHQKDSDEYRHVLRQAVLVVSAR